MTILNSFRNNILSKKLIAKGDTVVVGISGGCDSMALAYLLNTIKHELGFQIVLAHYNHKLRASADKDEAIVTQFAQQWNLPLVIASWKNPPSPSDSKMEEKARKKRQSFFKKVIKKYSTNTVALAHHQDDTAETILMKIIRGTGKTGLTGIASDRTIDEIRYIRPLLNISKTDIIAFCKEKHIQYLDDPTNTDTKFFRNKVRHQLLPLIKKEYNDKINDVLSSNALILSDESDFLSEYCDTIYRKLAKVTKKKICFETKSFVRQHIAMQRLLIRKTYSMLTGSTNQLSFTHVERVCNSLHTIGKTMECPLTKGVSARISADTIHFIVN